MQAHMSTPSGEQSIELHPAKRIHPLGRMLFAASLLAALIGMHGQIPLLLCMLTGSALLVGWLSASWVPVLRAARLLLWLVVPVLLLHLIFTPGALLWPGSPVPFTREGLQQGGWLALRLCAMFYVAMLLSRSLSREEWTYYCLRLPFVGSRLLAYVKLSPAMRGLASRSLAEARMNLNAGWRSASDLPAELGELVSRVWQGALVEATNVWRQWEYEEGPRRPRGSIAAGAVLAGCGLLVVYLVWTVR